MKENKVYAIYGRPAYDFTIYLASILGNLGKRVLVVDHSKERDIMKCYSMEEEGGDHFHDRNIDYMGVEYCEDMDREKYEYIFEYLNQKEKGGLLGNNEYAGIFVVTDSLKENLIDAGEIIRSFKDRIYLILRDSCCKKMDVKYLFHEFFQIDSKDILYWELDLDYYDYSYRITMTHEIWQGFQKLSKPYQLCLREITKIIAYPSLGRLKKAYQRAERGKYIESSFLE